MYCQSWYISSFFFFFLLWYKIKINSKEFNQKRFSLFLAFIKKKNEIFFPFIFILYNYLTVYILVVFIVYRNYDKEAFKHRSEYKIWPKAPQNMKVKIMCSLLNIPFTSWYHHLQQLRSSYINKEWSESLNRLKTTNIHSFRIILTNISPFYITPPTN